jgi:hypothetical protein
VDVVGDEYLGPKLESTSLDEVTSLVLEHGVVVGNRDQLVIAEAFGICDICKIRVPLLAVFADD